ncbi:peptidase S8/S53 domain-containing protein [Radiomyces spectabilis]|uniref:peptidase S8/S53 domain-containing protein n=1 Tax=Radiomyces spectabilis TaxID=64574 RepID=UPI00221F2A32|nr:peptidase S8/S53 domain-containing protein [Radiomyces spectabilis]KAI8374401.1 peptidase S8/S53 domain-containing protein [Radiomyces spectabilis]
MKKRSLSILPLFAAGVCFVVLVFSGTASARIHHPKYKKAGREIIPGQYVIEFSDGQTNHGDTLVRSIRKEFKHADVKVKEKYHHSLFNGVSFDIKGLNEDDHQNALKSILDQASVASVYPVTYIDRPATQPFSVKAGEPSILPHAMTQVDRVHKELKNTGKGIVVGILDTGIDYKHPALGGGFGPGYKVAVGADVVGDDYTAENPVIKPNPTPLDECGASSGATGHGTHVAGIIGGYDPSTNFTGVAPDATLGMWRVFGCNGRTGNDIIIKALLMAYDAGCDILSLSLGDNSGWSEGAENVVAERIVKKGVPVIVAAGNDGASGVFTVGSPSTAPGVMSVASFDNAYILVKQFTVGGDSANPILTHSDYSIGYIPGSKETMPDGELVLADPNGSGEGCDASKVSADVKGKLALIKRGTCTFDEKAINVAKAGAIGAVIYNSDGDAFGMSMPTAPIPAVSVSSGTGAKLIGEIKKGKTVLTFKKKDTVLPSSTGNTVSSFSSVGASYELHLRPNLAGIGGNVFSTLPRYLGSWGSMSGTSMATPYVSGTLALYLNALGKKKQKPEYITEQLQNYAYIAPYANDVKELDSPLRQGAGLVQIYDAIKQDVHISPAQISFNDTSSSRYKTHTLTITNHGHSTITYQVINNVSTAIAPYDLKKSGYAPVEPTVNVKAAAKLRVSSNHIRVPPRSSKKVRVTVIPPRTDPKEHIMYGGFVQFKALHNRHNNKDITVPYFGVVGDQRELPIFDDSPYLSDITGSNIYGKNETFVFDPKDENTTPYILFRLLTPTARIDAELLDHKNKVIGYAFNGLEYLPRNTMNPENYMNVIGWSGTYVPKHPSNAPFAVPVPPGTYRFRWRALKLLGNPHKHRDYEVWESGPIKVV